MSASSGGSRLGWVILEAALIVLGLGAGWMVTEWQESRQRAEAAEEAEAAMIQELTENRDRLAEARDYHTSTSNALAPWIFAGAPGEPDAREVFLRGYVRPAQVFDAAWETAGETGALRDIDARTRSTFADAYARLEGYKESAGSTGEIIYQSLWDNGYEGTVAKWREIHALTQPLLFQECQLLAVLDEVLATWGMEGTLRRSPPDDPGMATCEMMLARGG